MVVGRSAESVGGRSDWKKEKGNISGFEDGGRGQEPRNIGRSRKSPET